MNFDLKKLLAFMPPEAFTSHQEFRFNEIVCLMRELGATVCRRDAFLAVRE